MPHYYSRRQPKRGVSRIITYCYKEICLTLHTSPNVFSPTKVDEGTKLLIQSIEGLVPEEGRVLDLGTGYGVIGIYLAKSNPSLTIYMSDVNPLALKLARINVRENGVESNTHVVKSDFYEGLSGIIFDSVYTNPPISAGFLSIQRIIEDTLKHLKKGGHLVMVLSRGWEKALRAGEKLYERVYIIRRSKGYVVLAFVK